LSVGRRSIQNLSKKVAQGYNEKGDGEGFFGSDLQNERLSSEM